MLPGVQQESIFSGDGKSLSKGLFGGTFDPKTFSAAILSLLESGISGAWGKIWQLGQNYTCTKPKAT